MLTSEQDRKPAQCRDTDVFHSDAGLLFYEHTRKGKERSFWGFFLCGQHAAFRHETMATAAAKEIAHVQAKVDELQLQLQSLRNAFHDFIAEWLWEEQRKEHMRAKRAKRIRSRKEKPVFGDVSLVTEVEYIR